MKLLIITLILQFPFFITRQGEDVKIDREIEMVDAIFSAYKDYKERNLESCTNKLADYGFNLSKTTNDIIPKDIKIDTLYFEAPDVDKYIFIRSVDLDYIRNINGFVILKSANAELLAEKFIQKLTDTNTWASVKYNEVENKFTITDNTSFIIYDDRWKQEVTSVFPSFYTCQVTVEGEFLDISFEEVVPKRFKVLNEVLLADIDFKPGL